MNNRALLLMLALVFCVGIFVFIYIQQGILNKEMNSIEQPTFKIDPIEVRKKSIKRKVARGALPRIDRANDPLAPVKPLKERVKRKTSSGEPKVIYDYPEKSQYLAQ